MQDTTIIQQLESKYTALGPLMNERLRRLWAAAEAEAYGWGGLRAVSDASGMSPTTIRKGVAELAEQRADPTRFVDLRIRQVGGGRKCQTDLDPKLSEALEKLVDPTTRGDPGSPLRWTCKSTVQLADELTRQGHPLSPRTVGRLLNQAGYSLQGTRKTKEGQLHPDRNAQFEYLNTAVIDFQQRGQPVISVDTKKKELVGEFRNNGREWHPTGKPDEVRIHDFLDKDLGKAIPYGVYDLSANQGWVSVGVDHDTAQFAAEAIRRWWKKLGALRYRHPQELLITADGGGSNGSRSRLWKTALQNLATPLALPIQVCHFPPGTSKWNKIEHRLFCHITQNWRGRPLIRHDVIINLIANTTTRTGLKVSAALDAGRYLTGITVSDEEFAAVNLHPADFHGDWNYRILPLTKKK